MDDIQETSEFNKMHEEGKERAASLDELAKHFGPDPLTSEGTSDAGEKPSRDEMPPVVAKAKVINKPKPPTEGTDNAEPAPKGNQEPKTLKPKPEAIRQTLEDGHTYTRTSKGVCVNCGLPKEKTTSVCFGRPLFPATLKKFEEGLIDFVGDRWIRIQ
jgi:hypothetical protein